MEWEKVKKEMVEEKGLAEDIAVKIGEYVKLSGKEVVSQLESNSVLLAEKDAVDGLEDMKLFLHYCESFGILDKVLIELKYNNCVFCTACYMNQNGCGRLYKYVVTVAFKVLCQLSCFFSALWVQERERQVYHVFWSMYQSNSP